MGEESLAETRLAVSTQRAELERDADQLRETLDLKKRFRENPALVIGLGAGALFLVAGGPIRVAKLIRRRAFRSDTEKAYDTLPKAMQSWVDSIAGTVGPRASEARETMAEELLRWRHDPKKHKKLAKKLAKQAAEGPPGPKRTAWNAFEAGAAILSAALARKAVERFLTVEPPPEGANPAVSAAKGAIDAAEPPDRRKEYSGMSSRGG
ncbi:MAG: hypothetical protein K5924_08660 [Chloroflexi bacterium]|nr:hypothetical protein [Chloroflexota bacterium]